ncbi:DUF3600 domain-containing protein [Paenibacillus sp.]|jgi:hypothetical protein|uniref:DUF3600 domain-containing protein n=1 Tax=Paenibacillus sp. TaxID=58172 RepID=UPI0028303014|nr:DUF3600 domain-containing protein [Paenibacillus sp.]MDR0269396.1 DUF3600 domain-containing protein [Paenibacillus sp.]
MSLDERLKTAFKEETKEWNAPAELKGKILNQVVHIQGGRRMKKWVVACILAATLLIPTGAFAGYSYLADSIYGSRENIGVTQKQYDELEAKLKTAKQNLSEEEYTKWMSLLKEWGTLSLKIVDANGDFNLERLSEGEHKNYKRLTTELEPLFHKLDEIQSTKREGKIVDSATFWNGVLDNAGQKFSKEEFDEFQKLVNELRAYDEKTDDPDGSVHMERLSKEDQTNIEQVNQQLQPFFKKLGITAKPKA